MSAKKVALTLFVTLIGISIAQLVALTEIEDCPLGSDPSNFAVHKELPKPLKPGAPC